MHGQTSVLASQQEPLHAGVPWGDAPGSSLHTPGDHAPTRPRFDILLSGHVSAPARRPTCGLLIGRRGPSG
ncbi:DUF2169 domain-containing protein [Sorangium sp. So ce887]|uniref:DUF2169 domain-containing protein n=1 Tax=Sorangium sp. So ce887 TaxID=3133324 RepID=UPI003F631F38